MSRKLLFYINTICTGGAERVISNLASIFSIKGYQVILVTSFCGDEEYELDPNVKRLYLEKKEIKQSYFKRNISRILKLRDICKKESPNIVISFMAEANCRALIATLGLSIKNIISVRNDPNYEYNGYVGKIIGRYLLPIADGCVFQTEEAKKWFPSKLQKKSRIIFNAVKEEFYQVKYKPISGNIVACGRLEKQKNFSMLIDAFADLSKRHSEIKLLIYGEGSQKKNLERQVERLELKEKIILAGKTQDIPKVLSNASIFVLSSKFEGMPNVLMEAMAVGVPCISTDCPCGGPKMLIRSEENGILVKNNDVFALINAIEDLLDNPQKATVLGLRAKESALKYRTECIFNEWKKYIDQLLNN